MPGWLEADAATRARIIAAAKCYLQIGEPEIETWLGKDMLSYRAAGGYRALRSCLQEGPDYLASLDSALWERWAPVVLGFPLFTGTDAGGTKAQEELLGPRVELAIPLRVAAGGW